ncbi:acVLRF1 family peptidyl-tRNA hydrolase [Ornithinimicrobium sp. W1665]|uniref:acVLRF1 family peptidyl-tRNA hydrolase n=1 Tax=Ornithinimicrobium sp. W1665 TaxID=3416666 RepID=UPI003CFB9ACD
MTVDVAPERLDGWLDRFADSHGEVTWSVDDGRGTSPSSWLVRAADGSWARLTAWRAATGERATQEWALPPALLVLLVRRGGYAVGLAAPDASLPASKTGTRHVQSRTAAGGWSQQRYARRRANQADALVEGVVGHAVRVLEEGERRTGAVAGLVLGGDRTLAAQVLDTVATGPRTRLHGIPRRELWDVPDPRRSVLEEAVRRGRAVRVTVHNA